MAGTISKIGKMKLFKLGQSLEEEDDFFVVAESKKEAEDIFLDSTKEIVEELTRETIPTDKGEIEEVTELTPKEQYELGGVIWSVTGLKNAIERSKLERLKEVVK